MKTAKIVISKFMIIKRFIFSKVNKAINWVKLKDIVITYTGQIVEVGFFPTKYL